MRYYNLKKGINYALNRISQHFLEPYFDWIKKLKWLKLIYLFNINLKSGLIRILHPLKGLKEPIFNVIGRDYVNWAVDRAFEDTNLLLRKSGVKITSNIFRATHIYCVWYDYILRDEYQWLNTLKRILNQKIIVVVINDIRNYEWKIKKYRNFVNLWVVPSNTLFKYLYNLGLNVNYIPTYMRPESFRPLEITKKELCIELGIDYEKLKNKVIIGSFQRDSTKELLTPKWQKNPDLLLKILKELPHDKYILILTGPRRHYIINQCEKHKIPFMFYGESNFIKKELDDVMVNNQTLEIVNLLYNLVDVYIVSSRIEGGPMAIVEASITKTLIFSTDVGFAKDFIHNDLIYSEDNFDKLISILSDYPAHKSLINEYISFNYNKVSRTYEESNYLGFYKSLIKHLEEKDLN